MNFLLADDHAIVREGMASALHDFDPAAMVLEAEDAARLLQILDGGVRLDLILIDLFMPGSDGFDLLHKVHERQPEVPVVVLSASEDPQHIERAMDSGASGFIPKSLPRDVILSAVALVLSGGVFVPPQLISRSARSDEISAGPGSGHVASEGGQVYLLTRRQMEVLRLMGMGKSNKEIARHLGLSNNTVKIHVTGVLRCLGVTNRTKAVLRARQLGLLIEE